MTQATTIAITNQKGGVAKTTSTANIGAELSRKGFRVLLVDMDGQGSLTYVAGHNYEDLEAGDAMPGLLLPDEIKRGQGKLPLESTLGPDLLPASPEMQGMDKDLLDAVGGQLQRLRTALEPFLDSYDFILIDSGPKLGPVTLNCLVAADFVLVPIKANAVSTRGFLGLVDTIQRLHNHEPGATPEILGIFATQVKDKTKKAMQVENQFRKMEREGGTPYLGSIRASVKVEEADDLRRSIREHKKDSKPSIDYAHLTNRIVEKLEQKGITHDAA